MDPKLDLTAREKGALFEAAQYAMRYTMHPWQEKALVSAIEKLSTQQMVLPRVKK